MKHHARLASAMILFATTCFAGKCDNPPTPGKCQTLDKDCNIVDLPKNCYSLVNHPYVCGDTGGSCPDCSAGACGDKTECLIYFYGEAVADCSGSAGYTSSVIAAKKTTTCDNQWDYAKLYALAIAGILCGVACYECYQTGGGLGCTGCWACLTGIPLLDLEMCDYMTACQVDVTAQPQIGYTVTHALSGGSCP